FVFGLWSAARFHWGPREVGLAFAVVGIVAAFCQIFLTARLSERFGEGRVLAAGMMLTAFALALQPFAHGAGVVLLRRISALGQWVVGPTGPSLSPRRAESEHQGHYQGLNNATGALARLTGPLASGFAFAGLSVDAPFYLAGALVLPAIFLALAE